MGLSASSCILTLFRLPFDSRRHPAPPFLDDVSLLVLGIASFGFVDSQAAYVDSPVARTPNGKEALCECFASRLLQSAQEFELGGRRGVEKEAPCNALDSALFILGSVGSPGSTMSHRTRDVMVHLRRVVGSAYQDMLEVAPRVLKGPL